MLPVTSTAIADTVRDCQPYDDGTGEDGAEVAYFYSDLSVACYTPTYYFYVNYAYVMVFR